MRDYGEKANRIWGGRKDCEHDFSILFEERVDQTGRPLRNRRGLNKYAEILDGHKRTTERAYEPIEKRSYFCSKCNAWFGQLGLEPDFNLYLDHLFEIFSECRRVLKRSGSLWIVIGDTYAGSHGSRKDNQYEKKEAYSLPYESRVTQKVEGIKSKSLIGVPWRLALKLIDEGGWILRNCVIWEKPNALPESVKDRFTNVYEYVFFFVRDDARSDWYRLGNQPDPEKYPERYEAWKKVREWWGIVEVKPDWRVLRNWGANKDGSYRGRSIKNYEAAGVEDASDLKRRTIASYLKPKVIGIKHKSEIPKEYLPYCTNLDYYFDLDSVRVPHAIQSLERYQRAVNLGAHQVRGKYKNSNAPQQAPKWFQELFDKDFNYKGKFEKLTKHDVAVGRVGNFAYTDPLHEKEYYPLGKNPGDIFSINTEPLKEVHFAAFPTALSERIILAASPRGGVVLDPFCGSGRTLAAAKRLGRQFIGFDIVPEYVELAKKMVAREPVKLSQFGVE